jgi:hypothetical protein
MFLHRDGEILSGDASGGVPDDDLFAMLREHGSPLPYGGVPPVHPATGGYHRFELTAVGGRTVDYGWDNPRTFYHHVPLQCWKSIAVGAVMESWFYGNSSFAVAGYTFPPLPGVSFFFTGNETNLVEIPLTLPHGCKIKSVSVKYWHDAWVGGAIPIQGQVHLYEQDTVMGVSATQPVLTSLASAMLPIAVGWRVINLGPLAVEVDINNKLYWVRVKGSYDDGAGQTTQLVAGVMVEYEMQSFMPA